MRDASSAALALVGVCQNGATDNIRSLAIFTRTS
jgi:hypothetical protein